LSAAAAALEGARAAAPAGADAQEPPAAALSGEAGYKMTAEGVSVSYSGRQAVRDVTMGFKERSVTALIGPSGCGKTTFLRCLNRMHDMTPGARVTGRIMLDGVDMYSRDVDPIYHRRKVGMVFQKPNPFPTMSVYDNVVAGLRLNGVRDRRALDEIAEDSLRMAFLWDEVSGSLSKPAVELSGGQQQRLCIARALAIQPEVLLMDEPASALDPIRTSRGPTRWAASSRCPTLYAQSTMRSRT